MYTCTVEYGSILSTVIDNRKPVIHFNNEMICTDINQRQDVVIMNIII